MTAPELPRGFELVVRGRTAWIEAPLAEHRVIFSLRNPPGSAEAETELDIGRTVETLSASGAECRARLCRELGVEPGRVAIARQVHGDEILELGDRRGLFAGSFLGPEPPGAEGDGFFVPAGPGSPEQVHPAVVTADCLSVAMTGPNGVALLHLGWRGLATAMLERAVELTAGRVAVIGPGIGPCCYRVGPEVFEALGEVSRTEPGPLDLASIALRRMAAAGVDGVSATGLCTSCRKELFFSHRRDGEHAGRQITMLLC